MIASAHAATLPVRLPPARHPSSADSLAQFDESHSSCIRRQPANILFTYVRPPLTVAPPLLPSRCFTMTTRSRPWLRISASIVTAGSRRVQPRLPHVIPAIPTFAALGLCCYGRRPPSYEGRLFPLSTVEAERFMVRSASLLSGAHAA